MNELMNERTFFVELRVLGWNVIILFWMNKWTNEWTNEWAKGEFECSNPTHFIVSFFFTFHSMNEQTFVYMDSAILISSAKVFKIADIIRHWLEV